jgi:hypothetical protein
MELGKVPVGPWFHVEIRLDLGTPGGTASRPTYRLAIASLGQAEQVFEEVPYLHPEFGQLMWFGFSNTGGPGTVFLVDNVRTESGSL